MKKLILILFALISMEAFSQIQIKEGSFKKINNYVMLDKQDHTDFNNYAMALIKITAEGMKAEERARLTFKGNMATYFEVKQKGAETYLYLTAKNATFVEILHPDYGKTEKYWFPEQLCDYCGYEMVVEYKRPDPTPEPISKFAYLIIKADQDGASIYIDDEYIGDKEVQETFAIGSTHTWKIERDMYHVESGSVTINDKTIIDKKLRPNFGYIKVSTTPEQGAKVFVDGKYIGKSPVKTDKLKSGEHIVKVEKEMFKVKAQSFTITDEQTTNATIDIEPDFINVTINADSQSSIYIDEEYKSKGKWSGRLSDGLHTLEARKDKHETSKQVLEFVLGEPMTITLEAPKPITGSLDVKSVPSEARIYIDGKEYGKTPNVINDILIGEHELKLAKYDYEDLKKKITITEGKTLTINEKLFEIELDETQQVVSGTVNGHDYVDLGLPSGLLWATCNIGGNKPENEGYRYAWGEIKTKEKYTKRNSLTFKKKKYGNDIKIGADPKYDAARAKWGGKWRLPTEGEFYELKNKCEWKWVKRRGAEGFKVIGPNGNSIFIPDSYYNYWSSTPDEYGSEDAYAMCISLFEEKGYVFSKERSNGYHVRPVIDNNAIKSNKSQNQTFTVNGVSFTMIKVEGGTFKMGAQSEDANADNYDKDAYNDEKPVHSVTLSDYYIGETEVTQELWNAVMGTKYFNSNDEAVIYMSWEKCNEFIEKLNELTGMNFRFPTEAEWEYAARGGKKSKGYKYSGSNNIEDVAWFGEDNYNGSVKKKKSNELGIYDMSGNVWEWCQDMYARYNSSPQTNPKATTGSYHVYRGGGWYYSERICRVTNRRYNSEKNELDHTGLRLAL